MSRVEIENEIASMKRTIDSLRTDLDESRSELGAADIWESINLIVKYQNKVNELESQLANAV